MQIPEALPLKHGQKQLIEYLTLLIARKRETELREDVKAVLDRHAEQKRVYRIAESDSDEPYTGCRFARNFRVHSALEPVTVHLHRYKFGSIEEHLGFFALSKCNHVRNHKIVSFKMRSPKGRIDPSLRIKQTKKVRSVFFAQFGALSVVPVLKQVKQKRRSKTAKVETILSDQQILEAGRELLSYFG